MVCLFSSKVKPGFSRTGNDLFMQRPEMKYVVRTGAASEFGRFIIADDGFWMETCSFSRVELEV